MKNLKRFFSIVLAFALALSLAIPSLAAPGTPTR